VTQPRVSDLMRGKIDLFGLDTLVNMAAAAGLQVEMRIAEAALANRLMRQGWGLRPMSSRSGCVPHVSHAWSRH
jgi:hypothetical protein